MAESGSQFKLILGDSFDKHSNNTYNRFRQRSMIISNCETLIRFLIFQYKAAAFRPQK